MIYPLVAMATAVLMMSIGGVIASSICRTEDPNTVGIVFLLVLLLSSMVVIAWYPK